MGMIIYLCNYDGAGADAQLRGSQACLYWSTNDSGNSGQTPDAVSNSLSSNSWAQWEGSQKSVHFSSTNTDFSFNIQGDAQSKPDFNWVGEGQYGGQWFDIFKDNKAQLFTQNRGGPWNVGYSKLYYCLPQPGS